MQSSGTLSRELFNTPPWFCRRSPTSESDFSSLKTSGCSIALSSSEDSLSVEDEAKAAFPNCSCYFQGYVRAFSLCQKAIPQTILYQPCHHDSSHILRSSFSPFPYQPLLSWKKREVTIESQQKKEQDEELSTPIPRLESAAPRVRTMQRMEQLERFPLPHATSTLGRASGAIITHLPHLQKPVESPAPYLRMQEALRVCITPDSRKTVDVGISTDAIKEGVPISRSQSTPRLLSVSRLSSRATGSKFQRVPAGQVLVTPSFVDEPKQSKPVLSRDAGKSIRIQSQKQSVLERSHHYRVTAQPRQSIPTRLNSAVQALTIVPTPLVPQPSPKPPRTRSAPAVRVELLPKNIPEVLPESAASATEASAFLQPARRAIPELTEVSLPCLEIRYSLGLVEWCGGTEDHDSDRGSEGSFVQEEHIVVEALGDDGFQASPRPYGSTDRSSRSASNRSAFERHISEALQHLRDPHFVPDVTEEHHEMSISPRLSHESFTWGDSDVLYGSGESGEMGRLPSGSRRYRVTRREYSPRMSSREGSVFSREQTPRSWGQDASGGRRGTRRVYRTEDGMHVEEEELLEETPRTERRGFHRPYGSQATIEKAGSVPVTLPQTKSTPQRRPSLTIPSPPFGLRHPPTTATTPPYLQQSYSFSQGEQRSPPASRRLSLFGTSTPHTARQRALSVAEQMHRSLHEDVGQ